MNRNRPLTSAMRTVFSRLALMGGSCPADCADATKTTLNALVARGEIWMFELNGRLWIQEPHDGRIGDIDRRLCPLQTKQLTTRGTVPKGPNHATDNR